MLLFCRMKDVRCELFFSMIHLSKVVP
jgi:hypothetical protein